MPKYALSFTCFFLLVISYSYSKDLSPLSECQECTNTLEKKHWHIFYHCHDQLQGLFRHRKIELLGERYPDREVRPRSYMPMFENTYITLEDRIPWLNERVVLFSRNYNNCSYKIAIVKKLPDDRYPLCIDESTAKNCGLVWNSNDDLPIVKTDIQLNDMQYNKKYYSTRWYSSVSAYYNALKSDITDVYTLSMAELDKVIETCENTIQRCRTPDNDSKLPHLYSADEQKCLCVRFDFSHEVLRKCCNCIIKDENYYIEEAREYLSLRQQEPAIYLACVDQEKEKARLIYQNIYDNCIKNHNNPWSYYQRGLIFFEQGEWEKSLSDILHLLKAYEDNKRMDLLPSQVFFDKGITESELGLYHDAIHSLSYVIEKDPNNKEAHFERAVAYFEEGAFDLALKDYLASGIKPTWDTTTFYDYGVGFLEGIQNGIKEELGETLPIAVPIMSVGMWALTKAPSPHAKIISASMACVAAAALYMTADQMVTELRYLVTNWDQLPHQQQGMLCGYLIGKYGIDIFAVAGSAKMMEAYRNLKRANNMLTFELMLTPEHEIALLKAKYKGVEKYRQDKKYIQQVYGKKTYPEQEIRNTLMQMGYEIPKRPESIPKNFETRYADGVGICYHDPANPKYNHIRLMPGTKYSPNQAQQTPYIIHTRDGIVRDGANNPTLPKEAKAHIPVEDFIYEPINKK